MPSNFPTGCKSGSGFDFVFHHHIPPCSNKRAIKLHITVMCIGGLLICMLQFCLLKFVLDILICGKQQWLDSSVGRAAD